MSRGYAEGPATEERVAAMEQQERKQPRPETRLAVYGSTDERPDRHFIGWRDEIDPAQLFEAGKAWGLRTLKRPVGTQPPTA